MAELFPFSLAFPFLRLTIFREERWFPFLCSLTVCMVLFFLPHRSRHRFQKHLLPSSLNLQTSFSPLLMQIIFKSVSDWTRHFLVHLSLLFLFLPHLSSLLSPHSSLLTSISFLLFPHSSLSSTLFSLPPPPSLRTTATVPVTQALKALKAQYHVGGNLDELAQGLKQLLDSPPWQPWSEDTSADLRQFQVSPLFMMMMMMMMLMLMMMMMMMIVIYLCRIASLTPLDWRGKRWQILIDSPSVGSLFSPHCHLLSLSPRSQDELAAPPAIYLAERDRLESVHCSWSCHSRTCDENL